MAHSALTLPYFDLILKQLDQGDAIFEQAFGRHVHWGYWANPDQATYTAKDYGAAAEQMSVEIYSAAQVQDHQTILDVGCGVGGTLASLNERFTNVNLLGLNLDERQLAYARQMVTARPENTIEFHQGNACSLPFADQSVDAVLAVECIFHFQDRKQFLQEALRVLKPGGGWQFLILRRLKWKDGLLFSGSQILSFLVSMGRLILLTPSKNIGCCLSRLALGQCSLGM